ncbi:glycosyltransferase family 4 protein [Chryseobacterium foetidum]|uniref:glycosyltransferase family 4 protein n=1 Tax=Chryseobacterium foetidum TaxID=2951057 RepID=UPI0021C58369|nr:glycosyltransferase family 4 protein [Chryseobacterium foetidum]
MKQINNILLITKEFQSDFQKNVGGTGVFYKNLAESLADREINVLVFGSAKKPFDIQKKYLSVHFVKDYFKKYFLMELLRSVTGKISFLEKFHYKIYDLEAEYLKKELSKFTANKNIDVIETHDWEGISRIAEDLKIPYIIRCHGSWSVLSRFFGYGAAKGKIYCEKKAFDNAENIITVSQSNEKMVREIFGNKDYNLIYNGIDTGLYKPPQNPETISKSIFFVGNVSTEKGADTALDAFIKVHEKENEATLHFIGKETELSEQLKRKIAENQLENNVIFYGKKNPDEVVKLLSKAEVIVFPSRGETFGLALIEAMALEKPVVCANLEVFSEIVSDGINGLIASESEFSEKVLELFSDRNKAMHLSTNARNTVVEKFSLKKMTDETLSYYQKINS